MLQLNSPVYNWKKPLKNRQVMPLTKGSYVLTFMGKIPLSIWVHFCFIWNRGEQNKSSVLSVLKVQFLCHYFIKGVLTQPHISFKLKTILPKHNEPKCSSNCTFCHENKQETRKPIYIYIKSRSKVNTLVLAISQPLLLTFPVYFCLAADWLPFSRVYVLALNVNNTLILSMLP